MKKHGPYAISEIIEKIRTGAYRMRRVTLMNEMNQRVVLEYQLDGRWLQVSTYHTQAIRAAQRRLAYRLDSAAGLGLYEVTA